VLASASVRSRVRFIVAIGLAVVLGAWLAWTSLGGALETYAGPSELSVAASTGDDTTYRLNGKVAPGSPKDPQGLAQSAEGLTFTVVDKEDPTQKVKVLYRGSVPDQFKDGREVVVTGSVRDGVFVAKPDSLVTLCPSKFSDRPDDSTPT
jgi:cytochrome c-type biogenesis protein CcmE